LQVQRRLGLAAGEERPIGSPQPTDVSDLKATPVAEPLIRLSVIATQIEIDQPIGYSSSGDSFFLRGVRARGFPALPAVPFSLLDGKEGATVRVPQRALNKAPRPPTSQSGSPEAAGHDDSGTGAKAGTRMGARADVVEVPDRRGVPDQVGPGAPKKVLVE